MTPEEKEELFGLILIELEKAEKKHPEFCLHGDFGLSLLTEEFLELTRAINDTEEFYWVIEEAAHVAVVAMRMIHHMDKIRKEFAK
jgi:hypothetical protein